ncbi:hypothetical protein [Methylicorpusculum sp.]|uniref:hypothetical protein n=1 Tax=Methylicorpusculum sp. TaxID=2713644 RepID=UPI00271C1883|nr:hypothetical protein [Methylicorpusculum sp.]MDO8844611.1 hypothetical protein [Methylicorpusculum sp.]
MNEHFSHGSESVKNGKLKGATDSTDYFYFFCPKCQGSEILRLLDYKVREEQESNPYDECKEIKSKSAKGFTLQIKLKCEVCKHSDTVKISNMGLQRGDHSKIL